MLSRSASSSVAVRAISSHSAAGAYRSAADQDTATASSIAAALLSYYTIAQVNGLLATGRAGRQVRAVRLRADGRHLRAGPRGAGEAGLCGQCADFAGAVRRLPQRDSKTMQNAGARTCGRRGASLWPPARAPRWPSVLRAEDPRAAGGARGAAEVARGTGTGVPGPPGRLGARDFFEAAEGEAGSARRGGAVRRAQDGQGEGGVGQPVAPAAHHVHADVQRVLVTRLRLKDERRQLGAPGVLHDAGGHAALWAARSPSASFLSGLRRAEAAEQRHLPPHPRRGPGL